MLSTTPTERPAAREPNARDAAGRESAAREVTVRDRMARDAASRNRVDRESAPRDPAPRRAASASASARPVRESAVSRTESTPSSSEESPASAPSVKPEFSALLAMLAGAGDGVRHDLVKQLPEEGVSLVDHLLEGAAENASANASTTAGDALHYGLLHVAPAAMTPAIDETAAIATAAIPVAAPPTVARTATGAAGAPPLTPASTTTGGASHLADQASDRRRTLEALARVATQRGSSVEQLLALGDTRGAAARQSLDALLDAAGTPAGARLAARQLMSASQRSLLGGDEATLEAMASLEALTSRTGGPAATTVTTPARDLTGVSPELQTRVQRVIDRMQQEHGHEVTVVETTRTQARQDWLYEQGRTRDGQVVTWTRDSAHTRGDAVDVMIDGSYANAEGFARLQRIAREEGLRTLGPRDPGHLELPRNGGDATGAQLAAAPQATRGLDSTESMPGGRGVARVAGVAGVAGVATVATAAGHGASDADGSGQFASRERAPRALATSRAARSGSAGSNAESAAFAMGAANTGPLGSPSTPVSAAPAMTGSAQAERVADLQQRRADAPAAPLSRMTLDVAGIDGTSERITVDVRGSSVSAHIATDADTADRLRLRTADLQDALGRHGLDGDSVRISATSRSLDGTESARAVSGERDALRLVASAGSAQDGAGANGQQGRAPRQWDAQDESRREQAARARDEREQRSRQDADDQPERQRRQTPFTGNA